MVVGFNHNFPYKGEIYHLQTEDGGVASPNIVTLLYHGGTILASRKTSYADIARVNNLEQVVEELMKEQHKGMLRGLKNGDFDEAIGRYRARNSSGAATAKAVAGPSPPGPPVSPPPAPSTASAVASSASPAANPLDRVVLAYLLGEEA